jgi:PP-loop superfamily ATP-utilizing enzyme
MSRNGSTQKICCADARCFYCTNLLAARHEHDHFPIPKRNGGVDVVCACINCHELKDRRPLSQWSNSEFIEAVEGATTLGRIIMAKFYALISDERAKRA